MTGIFVIIAISWLLLYLIEKQHILVLGFLPLAKRFKQFLSGFLITAILCALTEFLESFLRSSDWIINETISNGVVLKSFLWDFNSVVTEELIFRGAMLYILIHRIGPQKRILISSIAFGIYHWFSFGIFGNVMAMSLVFIGTALMGCAWALAFAKTTSIMLPIGLHLGWNSVYNTIFSKGPLGPMVLIQKGGSELTNWASFLNFISGMVIVPIIVLIYVKYFVRNELKVGIKTA
ncbi:CPBP family intramembrane glutamic endopeptidase [Mangrovimonas sp. TPBH4]|uniref:CPBP family intramembrane glutamic endopeptidase n=1 Tax=Mangrovimonas sp. TPBH4 TaxID=1645914 RepID=UPI0006B46E67|nr:CPBP family intramembrane glutamic endopeptidase [Mangrovimonas sp. TPBH4]